jgi:hypothetical protein
MEGSKKKLSGLRPGYLTDPWSRIQIPETPWVSEHKIEYIRNFISIHKCYGEWYNSRKALKTRKRVKNKHISECPSIFGHFFLASLVNATNSYSLYQQTI